MEKPGRTTDSAVCALITWLTAVSTWPAVNSLIDTVSSQVPDISYFLTTSLTTPTHRHPSPPTQTRHRSSVSGCSQPPISLAGIVLITSLTAILWTRKRVPKRYQRCCCASFGGLFTQPPMRRMRICFTDVFFCFFCFFLFFFHSPQNTRQPFSGTAERIFMKLLPNDIGKMEFPTSCRRLANDSELVYAGSVLYGGCVKTAWRSECI